MNTIPPDDEPYQPTEEDWREYSKWAANHPDTRPEPPQDHWCQRHQCWYESAECPACEVEDAELDYRPEPESLWYADLLLQASHGQWDPHHGWRAEQ